MSDKPLCVLRLANRCARDDEPDPGPREARFGLVCGSCYRRLEQDIAEMPALMDDLTLALRRPGTQGQRVSGTGEEPTFINGKVVTARAQLLAVCQSWSRVVSEDRGLTLPAETPEAVAAFLVRHLDWIVEQSWVDEMAREVDRAFGRGRSLAFPSGARRITLKDPKGKAVQCVERFPVCDVITRKASDGARCDGCLQATVWPGDELVKGEITCSECGAVTPSSRWYGLGERWMKERVA